MYSASYISTSNHTIDISSARSNIRDINITAHVAEVFKNISFKNFLMKWLNSILTNHLDKLFNLLELWHGLLIEVGSENTTLDDYSDIKKMHENFYSLSKLLYRLPNSNFGSSKLAFNKVNNVFLEILKFHEDALFNWEDYDTSVMSSHDLEDWQ